MSLRRVDKSGWPTPMNVPPLKMRNIACVHCRRSFYIKDINSLKGVNAPFVRHCGHVVCGKCAREYQVQACPVCSEQALLDDGGRVRPVFINIHVLGQICASQLLPVSTNSVGDGDFTFRKTLIAKVQQEVCSECQDRATCKCFECGVSYCSGCFSKFHSFNKTRGHARMDLDTADTNLTKLPDQCGLHDQSNFEYWCTECNVHCCLKCVIEEHRLHNTIPLAELNEEHRDEFETVYAELSSTLAAVYNSKKKLKNAQMTPEGLEGRKIQDDIAQHFLFLHGILQNLEMQMMETLKSQTSTHKDHLLEIEQKLRTLEDQLNDGIMLCIKAVNHSNTFNHAHVIEKIRGLINVPCYLTDSPRRTEDSTMAFVYAEEIVETLKNHCQVVLDTDYSPFKLISKAELPEDTPNYELNEELMRIPNIFKDPTPPPSAPMSPLPERCPSTASSMPTSEAGQRRCLEVHITYIAEEPFTFYARPTTTDVAYDRMQLELTEYEKECEISETPDQMKMYAIRKAPGEWFRGRIHEIEDEEEAGGKIYRVMNIDSGGEHWVALADIRMLKAQHADEPALAQRYSLLDIYPLATKTPAECQAKMTEILKVAKEREQLPTIYYVGDEDGVDILIPAGNGCDPISVRDALLFMGYGSFSSLATLLRSSHRVSNAFFHEILRTHTYQEVECLHVEAPNIIYVSLMTYDGVRLQTMLRKMSEMYNQTKKYKSLIYNPTVGLNVAVKYANLYWLRGTIIGIPEYEKIEVFLVDLGTTTVLPYTKIRQLDPSYTAATTRAIKIQLKDISPVENVDMTAVDKFVREFMEPSSRVIVDSVQDTTHIASIVRNEDTLAFALVLQGYAEPTTEELKARLQKAKKKKHRAQKKQLERALSASVSYQSSVEPWIPEKKPERKTDNPYEVEVCVEHVISPDEIYVALYQRAEYFDEIHRRMQTFYNEQRSREPLDITQDMLCTAYVAKNCAYYRVNIVAVNDNSTASVFLIDQGRTEIVPISDLQSLAPELLEIPACIFRVRLGGILPCGDSSTWPSASCSKLKDILLEYDRARMFMAKIDDDEDGVMTVELMVRKVVALRALEAAKIEKLSVNRMLVDEGLALNIRNFARQNVLAVDIKREINFLTSSDDPPEETEETTKENNEAMDMSDDTESTDSVSTNEVPRFRFTPTDDMVQWLPPEPLTQKTFMATPFFLDWPGFVYLHPDDPHGKRVHEMTQALNERFKNTEFDENIDGAWQPGDMGTVKWVKTGQWCRAYVHGVKRKHVAVEYIDYGTYMWERIEFMRHGVMFEDVPIQATKCKIHELAPNTHDGSWRRVILDGIQLLLAEKSCEVHLVAQNSDYATVIFQKIPGIEETLLNHLTIINADVKIVPGIRDYLGNDNDTSTSDDADVIIEGMCNSTNTADDDRLTIGTCSEIDDMSECFDETLNLGRDNLTTVPQPEITEKLDDVIQDVINEENVSVAEEITLQDPLETVYELPPLPAVDETVSEPADTKNTKNQVNKKINVEEKLAKLEIWKKITPVKLACSALSTVDEVSENMSQVTTDNEATKYLETNKKNSNTRLSSKNSDCSSENTTKKKKKWVPNHAAPDFIPLDLPFKKYRPLNIPNNIKTFTAVIGEVDASASNHLWLHIIASEDDTCLELWHTGFTSIYCAMQEVAEVQPLLQDFTPNKPCCAKNTSDHVWHRAVVTSAPPDCGTVELNYIDSGKSEWVLRDEIHCLKPEWLQVPMMAIKCRLWNVVVTNNGPALRYLREISNSGRRRFYVTIEDRDTDVLSVKMYYTKSGVLVNTEILKSGNYKEIKPDRKAKSADKHQQ